MLIVKVELGVLWVVFDVVGEFLLCLDFVIMLLMVEVFLVLLVL